MLALILRIPSERSKQVDLHFSNKSSVWYQCVCRLPYTKGLRLAISLGQAAGGIVGGYNWGRLFASQEILFIIDVSDLKITINFCSVWFYTTVWYLPKEI